MIKLSEGGIAEMWKDEKSPEMQAISYALQKAVAMVIEKAEKTKCFSDIDKLDELCAYIKSNSLCGLGQTAPNPVLSTLRFFRDEYIAHVVDKKCPAGVCKHLLSFSIDRDKCIGCGKCAKNCPVDTIHKTDYVAPGHKLASYVIDASKCVKCGACMSGCKFGAISKK